jgi:ATP-binding cassette subfamily C protein CydC
LTRAWDPQRGQIRFNNTLLTDFSEQALRKTVSVVPQRVHLFSATLRDNLLLAAPEALTMRFAPRWNRSGCKNCLRTTG